MFNPAMYHLSLWVLCFVQWCSFENFTLLGYNTVSLDYQGEREISLSLSGALFNDAFNSQNDIPSWMNEASMEHLWNDKGRKKK
jgi:hypothetical protein